jgi:hypothetical protein
MKAAREVAALRVEWEGQRVAHTLRKFTVPTVLLEGGVGLQPSGEEAFVGATFFPFFFFEIFFLLFDLHVDLALFLQRRF